MQESIVDDLDERKIDRRIPYQNLFLVCYFVWIARLFIMNLTLISEIVPSSIFSFMRISALMGFILIEVTTIKFNYNSLISIIFGIISAITSLKVGSALVLEFAFVIYCSRNISFKLMLKTHLILLFSLSIITVFLSHTGAIENRIFYQNGRIRESLGFIYTTFLPQILFFAILCYVSMKRRKLSFWEYSIIFLLNFLLYKKTGTRNPFILSNAFLIVILAYNNFYFLRRKVNYLGRYFFLSFIIFGIFEYLLTIWYGEGVIPYWLNDLLSGRLALGSSALKKYSIPLIGQKINLIGSSAIRYGNLSIFDTYNYIDSAYLQLLIIYGKLYSTTLISLLSFAMSKVYKSGNFYLLISLVFVSLHAILDPQMLLPWYSPFLLIIGKVLCTNVDLSIDF